MATFSRVEYYRDPYGCTAVLRRLSNGTFYLTVTNPYGIHLCKRRPFLSHRGAKIALGKMSDGMMQLIKKED